MDILFTWRASHTVTARERRVRGNTAISPYPMHLTILLSPSHPRQRVGTARAVPWEVRVMILKYFREITVQRVMSCE